MEKKYYSGFTLVELIIVISIIGTLAAITILYFTGQLFKGNDAKRKGDIDRIKVAAEEYEKDNNCYPKLITCGIDSNQEVYPYLNNVPCDPVTNNSYAYEPENAACPSWFRIYAILQNTQDLSIIPGIGPGSVYNYYKSSANAPLLEAGPTPTPQVPVQYYWGCKSGVCVPIDAKLDGSGPVCQPGFDNANCNGTGNCGSASNPLNECI